MIRQPLFRIMKTLKYIFSKKKMVIGTIWMALCLSGMIYQTVLISTQYFEYPTTSDVLIEYEHEIIPPAVSVCFDLGVLINKKMMKRSCHLNQMKKCNSYYLKRNVSFTDFMHVYTMNIKFKIMKSTMRPEVTMFWKDNQKCYRLQLNKFSKMNMSDKVRIRSSVQNTIVAWMMYRVDKKRLNQSMVSIYIHDKDIFPRLNSLQYARTSLKDFLRLTYRQYISDSRKLHFSKCQDYSETPYESYSDCEESKLMERIQKRLVDFTYTNFTGNPPDGDLKRTSGKLRGFCRHDCLKSFYQPSAQGMQSSQLTADFVLYLNHRNPTTKVIFSQKLILLEYMIYVASASSLWFGFVVFDSFKALFLRMITFIDIKSNQFKLQKHNHKEVFRIQNIVHCTFPIIPNIHEKQTQTNWDDDTSCMSHKLV